MRQITLRGIPVDIESIAQKEAKSKGVSMNKAFLSLLRKGAAQITLKGGRNKGLASEFSQFLGLWERGAETDFDTSLKEQRQIDKELWA